MAHALMHASRRKTRAPFVSCFLLYTLYWEAQQSFVWGETYSKTLQSAAITAVIIIIWHKRKRKRKLWMTSFLERRNNKLNIIWGVRMCSCVHFRNFTMMTARDFVLLLSLIGPSIRNKTLNMRQAIQISAHLSVTLCF
jgi:hypothetical protein